GCVYFGISVQPKRRWEDHVRYARDGHRTPFHQAIQKHGAKAFDRQFFWLPSRAAAVQAEQAWIAEARRRGIRTYNVTSGGDNRIGSKRFETRTGDKAAAQKEVATYRALTKKLAAL